MAPIPVYTDSPIAAAKASGVTPQTAPPSSASKPTPTNPSPASPSPASYPPAQPGASPSIPAPTSSFSRPGNSSQPIQTFDSHGPPAPQPGATPTPPGATRPSVPPPPKAGEKPVSVPYPQQMSIPPPTAPYPSQQHGTSTAPLPTSTHSSQVPAASYGLSAHSLEHPPGYHQNSNASELDRYQRSAIQQSEAEEQAVGSGGGVWESAKKWAYQTGEKLAAAENEVWKKINKE